MKTKSYTVYRFEELSEKAKEKAIQGLADINVDDEWWLSTYEDAEQVGLKITGFDIGRAADCDLTNTKPVMDVINAILKNHGEKCETYKTALEFKNQLEKLDEDSGEYEDTKREFIKSISEDYRIILQGEYEYLTSKEAIIEIIEANEYTFTETGKMDNIA